MLCKSAAKPYDAKKHLFTFDYCTQYGFACRVQRTFNSNKFQTSTLLQKSTGYLLYIGHLSMIVYTGVTNF